MNKDPEILVDLNSYETAGTSSGNSEDMEKAVYPAMCTDPCSTGAEDDKNKHLWWICSIFKAVLFVVLILLIYIIIFLRPAKMPDNLEGLP